MKIMMTVLWLISFVLFLGLVRFLLIYQKPGFYPPRHVIKKQMVALAGGCGLFFFIGLILYKYL